MNDLRGSRSTLRVFIGVGAVLGLLFAAAFVTGAVGSGEAPTGEDVLDRVHERYSNAETIVGNATVMVTNGSVTVEATVEFAFAVGNRSRVVVHRDAETYRAGSNGTIAWAVGGNYSGAWRIDSGFDGGFGRGTVGAPASTVQRTTHYDLNRSNVTATLVESTTIEGTAAYVVELTHENRDGTATLWVGKEEARVLRAEFVSGANRTVVTFEETRFNTSIHPSTFAPPSDRLRTTTIERFDSLSAVRNAASVPVPSPEGWRFAEAVYTRRSGGEAVVGRFVDGGTNLTVVSTTLTGQYGDLSDLNGTDVAIGDATGTLASVRDRTVVTWRSDGVTYAVLTDAAEETALSAARSIEAE